MTSSNPQLETALLTSLSRSRLDGRSVGRSFNLLTRQTREATARWFGGRVARAAGPFESGAKTHGYTHWRMIQDIPIVSQALFSPPPQFGFQFSFLLSHTFFALCFSTSPCLGNLLAALDEGGIESEVLISIPMKWILWSFSSAVFVGSRWNFISIFCQLCVRARVSYTRGLFLWAHEKKGSRLPLAFVSNVMIKGITRSETFLFSSQLVKEARERETHNWMGR